MKRLKFVILQLFEEIYRNNPVLAEEAFPRFEKVQQFEGTQSLPSFKGSLLFTRNGRYLVVSAGNGGGIVDLVRCWQQVTRSNKEHPYHITLFHVHLSSGPVVPTASQNLWEFLLRNARDIVGDRLNGYFATCHRPPFIEPHSEISLSCVKDCRSQLVKQGILTTFRQFLSTGTE